MNPSGKAGTSRMKEMKIDADLLQHLGELRKRLFIVAAAFLGGMCVGLYVSPGMLRYMKSRPVAAAVEWNVFSFTDGLFIYMKCAFTVAVLISLPVLLYQLWAFARPGLTEQEAKGTLAYVPASCGLFITGILFSYFVVFPMMLRFMKSMNESLGAVETYGMDHYFSFLFTIVFPMGVAFEMPVVVLFLTKLGFLDPDKLRKTRKYTYVGLAVVGSLISPPDFVSHLSVTIPLIVLFEISVLLSGRYIRKLALLSANTP